MDAEEELLCLTSIILQIFKIYRTPSKGDKGPFATFWDSDGIYKWISHDCVGSFTEADGCLITLHKNIFNTKRHTEQLVSNI